MSKISFLKEFLIPAMFIVWLGWGGASSRCGESPGLAARRPAFTSEGSGVSRGSAGPGGASPSLRLSLFVK